MRSTDLPSFPPFLFVLSGRAACRGIGRRRRGCRGALDLLCSACSLGQFRRGDAPCRASPPRSTKAAPAGVRGLRRVLASLALVASPAYLGCNDTPGPPSGPGNVLTAIIDAGRGRDAHAGLGHQRCLTRRRGRATEGATSTGLPARAPATPTCRAAGRVREELHVQQEDRLPPRERLVRDRDGRPYANGACAAAPRRCRRWAATRSPRPAWRTRRAGASSTTCSSRAAATPSAATARLLRSLLPTP